MDSSGLDGLTVLPPGRVRRKQEGGGRGGEEEEERGGLCAEGPGPRLSHPEDLCSLAGWFQRRHRERARERESEGGNEGEEGETRWSGRYSNGGLGPIVTLLSLLRVASEGALAASANFRLAQTCELLGAN